MLKFTKLYNHTLAKYSQNIKVLTWHDCVGRNKDSIISFDSEKGRIFLGHIKRNSDGIHAIVLLMNFICKWMD